MSISTKTSFLSEEIFNKSIQNRMGWNKDNIDKTFVEELGDQIKNKMKSGNWANFFMSKFNAESRDQGFKGVENPQMVCDRDLLKLYTLKNERIHGNLMSWSEEYLENGDIFSKSYTVMYSDELEEKRVELVNNWNNNTV